MATLVHRTKPRASAPAKPTKSKARVALPKGVTMVKNAAPKTAAKPADMDRAALEAEVARLKGLLADMRSRADIMDAATGLPKRTRFMELAGAEFARTRRYNHDLTLLVAKVPGLKRLAEQRGAEGADQVMMAVSEMCVSSTRFGVDILGRIADDKIAMLLPETDIEGGNRCLERMRKLVTTMPITIDGEKVKVGLHVSARPLKEEHSTFVELLVTA
ncbi:MAG: diguanylate cyclase [Pseudomonadota bacterium]